MYQRRKRFTFWRMHSIKWHYVEEKWYLYHFMITFDNSIHTHIEFLFFLFIFLFLLFLTNEKREKKLPPKLF